MSGYGDDDARRRRATYGALAGCVGPARIEGCALGNGGVAGGHGAAERNARDVGEGHLQ
jgi:hypothetical protein